MQQLIWAQIIADRDTDTTSPPYKYATTPTHPCPFDPLLFYHSDLPTAAGKEGNGCITWKRYVYLTLETGGRKLQTLLMAEMQAIKTVASSD